MVIGYLRSCHQIQLPNVCPRQALKRVDDLNAHIPITRFDLKIGNGDAHSPVQELEQDPGRLVLAEAGFVSDSDIGM